MGSEYELTVGATRVAYGKNHLDHGLLLPFQRTDLCCHEFDDDDGYLRFEAPARIVGRRLDLLGFTLAQAEVVYSEALPGACEEFMDFDWPATLTEWQRTVAAKAARLHSMEHEPGWSVERSVWEETMLGFPGGDIWHVVRALVDAYPNDALSLDLSDMARGGYVANDGSDLTTEGIRDPLIILTEGKSDARLLRAAIDTLFADYSEFIRFIDYDFARAAGGVGEVVRFVKMFAASGIKNRIVALFDNDTAGREACDQLGGLPPNVFPICLPTMALFSGYPSLGPDGRGISDIDGRACSLELYLGPDALADSDGRLRPVRWTGFNEKMSRYQGEVCDKALVQARFEAILRQVRANPAERDSFEFAGIEAIFQAILSALTGR